MDKLKTNRFPENGQNFEDILAIINTRKFKDAKWQNGKTFGYVYDPGDDLTRQLKEVYALFYNYNALNITLFPSLVAFENETVSMVGDLLHGDKCASGNITSGGTESIFMAVKSARDKARKEHPEIVRPAILIPRSAHPAFRKAAHYLGLSFIPVNLGPDWRTDLNHLSNAIDRDTIMIAGSAPCYPYGVVDPVEEIAKIAIEHNLWFHVDACLGGFMLPFVEKLGYAVPVFDFRVPGVTSMSADVHKYGYGAKGASIILYRNSELRKNQFFVSGDWPGGLFGSATMMGTRSGGPIVTAWTVIKLLGWEGYMKMAEKTMYAVKTIQNGLQTIPGLDIISNPEMSVFAITSSKNNIYEIGDEMSSRGWHFDRIMEPEAIHINVTNSNVNQVDEFLKDLEEVVMNLNRSPIRRLQSRVSESILTHLLNLFPKTVVDVISSSAASGLGSEKQKKHSRTATFYGIAAKQTDKGNVDAIILDFLDKMYNQNE